MSKHIIDDMNSVPEKCSCGNTMYWYGDWYCSNCQEEDHLRELDNMDQWYSQSAKCQQCGNADGGDWSDKCHHYKMPLYMCKRKKRCKYYIKIEYYESDYFYD